MKKKISVFLLVLVSVIACVVCLVACNNEGAPPAEYVGKYEFVSLSLETSFNGEEPDKTTIETGMPNVDKDFLSLTLNGDGKYEMVMSPSFMAAVGAVGSGNGVLSGKWSVSDGNLILAGSSYGNGILANNVLTFTNENSTNYDGQTMSAKQELILKKVVSETPSE